MSIDVDDLDLARLPALHTETIDVEEAQKVRAAVGRLRSPEKRVGILAALAVTAEGEAERLRGRRNELLAYLRWAGNRRGIRNLGLADAMGVYFTRPSYIIKDLGVDVDATEPPAGIDPGTAPVGEFRDIAEQVYRAEQRRDTAIVMRDAEIVKLHEKGLSRQEIHRLAGGVFDPSLISQIVTRARKRSEGR